MSDERVEIAPGEIARWGLVAAMILIGVGLYLWLAPGTPPIALPSTWEVIP